MKKFVTKDPKSISDYFNTFAIQNLVTASNRDKPIFLVKMSPLHDDGLFAYKDSSDELVFVPCIVTETRYAFADNYKIELQPVVPGFCKEYFYFTDFAQMLRAGSALIIDQSAPEIPEPVGFAKIVARVKEKLEQFRSGFSNQPYRKQTLLKGRPGLKYKASARFEDLFGARGPVRYDK